MVGIDGAVVVFNGEIYNYIELRSELARLGGTFDTATDTEVVLEAFRLWGIKRALQRFNGMWALAWLAPNGRRVVLSRDRCGEKPLYYTEHNRAVLFASEIKTLVTLTGTRFEVDPVAVAQYLDQSLLEATDGTFYREIRKVPARSFMVIDVTSLRLATPESYWTVPTGPSVDTGKSVDDVTRLVQELVIDAVAIRLRSDVPVGVLLSGGIDSSSIAAAAHADRCQGGGDLTLVSVVSSDPDSDESSFIDAVARHLGRKVQKVSLDLQPNVALRLLREATYCNDQPLQSFSAVAHFLLMEKAKQCGVTVLLSGQGADELFCGYRKYLGFHLQAMLREGALLRAASTLLSFVRNGTVIGQFELGDARRYLPGPLRPALPRILGDRVREVPPSALGLAAGMTLSERQALDIERFSVPALVHYEDRMSMAWSREIRLPFLDPRLIEFAVPMATEFKIHDGWTKLALRRAMAPLLPPDVVWRRDKKGFSVPQDLWLRTSLASEVAGIFREDCLMYRLGLVSADGLRETLRLYLAQAPDRKRIGFRAVFGPLALETWLRTNEGAIAS